MTDTIVQWLLSAGEGKFLATVLISMLPVIELRGGLPAGVAMGLPLREAFFAALLDLRLKLAVPAITAGVFLAGIIISLLTYGAAALL